jgi:hypothetical protein
MQFTRMPSLTWSSAIARVSASTAPFDAQYAARLRRPTSAATDAMFTIDPRPRAAIAGIACLQHRNVPRAFTAKTRSQTSSGVSGAVVVDPTPATLTSTSTGPTRSAASMKLDTEPSSATSKRAQVIEAPAADRSASSSRSPPTTRAPSAAKRAAIAAPMPDAAPVTTAIFPSSLMLASFRG